MKKIFNILLFLAFCVSLHAQERVYEDCINNTIVAKERFLDEFSYQNYSKSVALSQAEAQTVCMSDLIGKTWQAVSGYDGSSNVDWSIVFTMKSSEHAFTSKTDKKVSKFLYNTYLCNDATLKYNATFLGNKEKGKYIVFERKYVSQKKSYEDLFFAQVLSFDGNKLEVKLKKSIVTFVTK